MRSDSGTEWQRYLNLFVIQNRNTEKRVISLNSLLGIHRRYYSNML